MFIAIHAGLMETATSMQMISGPVNAPNLIQRPPSPSSSSLSSLTICGLFIRLNPAPEEKGENTPRRDLKALEDDQRNLDLGLRD